MKQLLYSFILALVISLNFIALKIIAQTPDWSWANQVIGTDDLYSTGIVIDHYGSIYVAGDFYANQTFGQTALTVGRSGEENPFLIRYDPLGNIRSAVKPEQIKKVRCNINAVAVDMKSNTYITGMYRDSLVFGSDTLINPNTNSNYNGYIAKNDAGGNAIWALNIGGSMMTTKGNSEEGKDIAIDQDGNIYCVGTFEKGYTKINYMSNGQKKTYTLTSNDFKYKDIFLLKYNVDGNLLWAKAFGGTSSKDYVNCMAIDASGNVIIGGYWTNGSISLDTYTFSNNGERDGYVFSVDGNGNILWANVISGTSFDEITDVVASDYIYVTGYVESDVIIGSGSLTNNGVADIVLVKYDQAGNVKWANIYGGNGTDISNGLALEGASENIYMTGYYTEDMYIDTTLLVNKGYNDILLAKFDSSGKSVWAMGVGQGGNEYGLIITCDSVNNLYFSGWYEYGDTLILGNDTLASTLSNGAVMFVAALIDFSDTVSIVDTTKIYRFDNGGLYGGTAADLTYTPTNRLFSGIETPASLFASDDGATTWYQVFDNDSLEYANETRGWSGKAEKILANQSGWVAVETNRPDLKYSSVAISFSNGDTNTWKTAVDQTLLNNWGMSTQAVTSIGLSDYYLLAALGPYVVKINSGPINPNTDIINILTLINGLQSTSTINSIALANSPNLYPYYIAIDEQGSPGGYYRLLYKNDGIAFTKIVLPSTLTGIQSVYTHPFQNTGDTIFITGYDDVNKKYKIYRSFDAGINWTDISYSSATTFLSDVDYSLNWNLSASNNLVLIIPGNAISKDLGNSWEIMSDTIYHANAIKPDDINTVVGSNKVVEISTTGPSGSFTKTPSYGLEALAINKIARTESEKYFYIATKNGLGYTSAYLDTNVIAGAKWSSPYGEFPMISDTINFGAVAIDPTDSLHVIAGSGYGFYTSTTGPNGFMRIVPSGFSTNDPQVKDVVFINHTTAIAVTGGDSLYDAGKGNIWRTIDGGLTWSIVSPSGFTNGNTIALGKLGTDTIIYIGTGLLNVEPGYLWKSSDLGQTWEQIKNGPTSLAGTTHLSLPINDIAVDPRGKDTVYIAAGYGSDYAFVLSLDGGETYLYLNSYAEKPYTSIGINRTYPDTVYCASGREIYLYDLANNNFRFVYRGLPDEKIPDIMTGSILVGTTTGFYTFDPQIIDDTTITKITSKTNNDIIVNVYPNPFKDEATINIGVKENGTIAIELYDLTGRKITTIYKGKCTSGSSHYTISSDGLATGSYLVYVKINGKTGKRLLYRVK